MPILLQITAAFNCGAPGKIVEQIGLLAKRNGWDVYVVHGVRHSIPSQLTTLSKVTPAQERIHALRSYLLDGHGLGSRCYTERVVEKIEALNPDVIHLHNLHGYYINYEVLFAYLKEAKKPIVWTFHDFWSITGHCAHFDYNGCEKWKTLCHDCKHHKEYPFSLIDRSKRNYLLKKKMFTGLDNVTLVPVSSWVGTLLAQSFLKDYPIRVIYNGIDTKMFRPRNSDVKARLCLEGKFVLLGVASPWSPMKGLYDYYDLRRNLTDDFAIVMVGLSKKQIEALPHGIIGIERTQSQDELAEYYSMADVTLNLSYQETFGMTTIEGMACGTPGIVYNKTASPELVSPETGYAVEAKNIKAIVKAVLEIKKKGKASYAEACRKRVLDNFDKNDRFADYVDLYDSLIVRS